MRNAECGMRNETAKGRHHNPPCDLASVFHSAPKFPLALAVALAACGIAASCGRYSFVNPEPYVGPAATPSMRTEAPVSVLPPPPERPAQAPTAAAPAAPQPVVPLRPVAQPVVPQPEAPRQPVPQPQIPQPAPLPVQSPTTSLGVDLLTSPQPIIPLVSALEPVAVTISDAVFTALENNPSLVVSRYNPQIFRTLEEQQKAVFDPDLTATASRTRTSTKFPAPGDGLVSRQSESGSLQVGYSQFFPAGTQLGIAAGTTVGEGTFNGNDLFTTRLGVSVTQSLMRGYGANVNLVAVRQARIDTLSSEYQLRGFAESLVAQVEETYWNYALAQRQIEIFNESLKLAQQQLGETNERIRVGKLAEVERAASEAEVALRREDLIVAQATLDLTRLALLRLINPTQSDFWNRDVAIRTPPIIMDVQPGGLEDHVRLALRMRPDLNQAKLQVQRGDLQVVRTKNGLLPKLDLFATLGKSGYADSFGESLAHMGQRGYDVLVGVNFEYPPLNRGAQAQYSQARLTRDQLNEAVTNLAQLVQSDVRGAYVSVIRTQEQTSATAVTRRLQEEKVRAETEKFRVGKSTSLLVAQVQRDLLSSRINEIQAVVNHLIALVEFYRLEGSLLERRGISSPGREPVELADPKGR